jgi:hypothetical protein
METTCDSRIAEDIIGRVHLHRFQPLIDLVRHFKTDSTEIVALSFGYRANNWLDEEGPIIKSLEKTPIWFNGNHMRFKNCRRHYWACSSTTFSAIIWPGASFQNRFYRDSSALFWIPCQQLTRWRGYLFGHNKNGRVKVALKLATQDFACRNANA